MIVNKSTKAPLILDIIYYVAETFPKSRGPLSSKDTSSFAKNPSKAYANLTENNVP
jgi:hypothetical protein